MPFTLRVGLEEDTECSADARAGYEEDAATKHRAKEGQPNELECSSVQVGWGI